MKIFSDKLTEGDLRNALTRAIPNGVVLELEEHGSRKRARRFDVALSAEGGADKHGLKRCYSRNSGQFGALGYGRAATYIEWGDWMVELFKIDPEAIVGVYDDSHDFIVKTQEYAPHRPARESAETHADRWSEELYWAAQEKVAV